MTKAERFYYQVLEAIRNTGFRQDSNDIYLAAWLFDVMREHPRVNERENVATDEWLMNFNSDSLFTIDSYTFIRYREVKGDFCWYAWTKEKPNPSLVEEFSGWIDATDNETNYRHPVQNPRVLGDNDTGRS